MWTAERLEVGSESLVCASGVVLCWVESAVWSVECGVSRTDTDTDTESLIERPILIESLVGWLSAVRH